MAKKSSVSKSTKSNSKAKDIRFIRLTNGEDIVAEVLDIANGRIVIDSPLKILYTPSLNKGYLSISLMQWVFTRISKQQKFDMDMVNVLIISEPEQSLIEHYNESMDTFDNKNDEDEDEEDDIDFSTLEGDEGIEMLKNLMDKIKGGKGRLH
jgi:hypothetical protein